MDVKEAQNRSIVLGETIVSMIQKESGMFADDEMDMMVGTVTSSLIGVVSAVLATYAGPEKDRYLFLVDAFKDSLIESTKSVYQDNVN